VARCAENRHWSRQPRFENHGEQLRKFGALVCGICGKLNFDGNAEVRPELIRAMADSIAHRGPDDDGFHVSGQVGLGFRRLAIIDLSGGHQPLANEDDTVWIVFNGEIYNYEELRNDLLARGHKFRTKSDTEVIVHLYEEYGENCVQKLRGMFAFAIWDNRHKTLFVARDRVGIKPLYYWANSNSLIFASEIKAILADPDVRREVYPAMIDRFLTFYYVPGNETLLKDIHKLSPGSYLTVKNGKVQTHSYWDLHFEPSNLSLEQAEEQLVALLEESVRIHMIADVPVGFLLSGGVDSTAMLALAVGKTDRPLSSFTIGFSESKVADERPFASLAARTYGSEHHETTISSKDFLDFLPQYVWHMEEPVCEPPAVALHYVSKLARNYVKVLISGEGGDEAFAGYPNYRNLLWLERAKRVAGPAGPLLGLGISVLGQILRSRRISRYAPLMNLPLASYYFSRSSSPFQFFNEQYSQFYTSDFLRTVDKSASAGAATKYFGNGAGAGNDRVNEMLYVDTKTWLVDDLLIKADKITMGNSVELRVPLLDHKLLEFAASLPGNYKVRGFTTKYIAKQALEKKVPREIIERKKAGFPVPYDSWLRGDLKDWLAGILLDKKTLSRGYFQKSSVEQLIARNQRDGGYAKEIFSLATLELWHRTFIDSIQPDSASPRTPSLESAAR
jgi:asparagine synthase (glutamine-hydrolysing)